MTGSRKPNPLPPSTSDEELAEEFATFFMNTIKKSGMHLMLILNLSLLDRIPAGPLIISLCSLKMKLKKIIMPMPSKSCELDALPTKVLKEIIKPLLPLLTKIIDLSLIEGVFVEEWKVVIIRPLLKKLGLDLISKNYRPVSNLPFQSKVVKSVH